MYLLIIFNIVHLFIIFITLLVGVCNDFLSSYVLIEVVLPMNIRILNILEIQIIINIINHY